MNAFESPPTATFEHLLEAFALRPGAACHDPDLLRLMQTLKAQHFDALPLPGQGRTLQRWQALARVAACDLSLTKLYEGHTDALAILAECAPSNLAREGLWGVWAAEPPQARVRITGRDGQEVRLTGLKAWCSGAAQLDRALITAWDETQQPQLVAIELGAMGQQLSLDAWQAVGMASTASATLSFEDSPGLLIGAPGQYLQRPGFWHGGGGIAACWYGAAAALAGYLQRHCAAGKADAHALAHLGAVDVALTSAQQALQACSRWIDRHPRADAELPVRRVRAQIEQCADQVLHHVGRALGATPFCRDAHFARLSADLPVFLRQSHAERDLAALGQHLSATDAGWAL